MFRERQRRRTEPQATTDTPQPTGSSLQQQADAYGNIARQIRRRNQQMSAEETLHRRRNASGQ